ncbi:phage tail assembly chaperone [Escherichia coli]|uniref:phage tail assembly chaperone n=1 Tax=Escherichia coli TaxID=562 RepID=UPI001CA78B50|nr:hypothetical protein [Escherichia coli]QZY67669.1 hypothetical protein K7X33_16375 [Escherichia coli]
MSIPANVLKLQKTATINGKEVKIIALPMGEGITIASKLAKAIIPAWGKVFAATGEPDVMAGFQAILENISADEFNAIVKRVFRDSTVDNFPIDPDVYFAANYGELVDFAWFALQENFGSFLKTEITKDMAKGLL